MTSDLWAFKGAREQAWSNYWRPLFVAWMAMNYRLFGLDPTGWHRIQILAHILVSALGYAILVRLKIRPLVSALAAWLFAVHPAHVESVAWASGVPDVLMSALLFGSYRSFLASRGRPAGLNRVPPLLLYGLALLTKESAIVFPAVILLTEWLMVVPGPDRAVRRLRAGLLRCLPFLLVALTFVITRYAVLGTMRSLPPGAPGFWILLSTVPSVLAFYIRQVVLPIQLGPLYGLRAVGFNDLGLINSVLPVAGLIALGGIW